MIVLHFWFILWFLFLSSLWGTHPYVRGSVMYTSQFTAEEHVGPSGQDLPFPQVMLSLGCLPCGW